jgi:hypothetical protein
MILLSWWQVVAGVIVAMVLGAWLLSIVQLLAREDKRREFTRPTWRR